MTRNHANHWCRPGRWRSGSGHGTGQFSRGPSRLYRIPQEGRVMGVCAGIADYFGVEPWVIRLGTFFSLVFFTLPTFIGYFLLGMFLPVAPEERYKKEEDAEFWRGVRVDPNQTFAALRHRFKELEQRLRGLEAYVTSREFRLKREFEDLES